MYTMAEASDIKIRMLLGFTKDDREITSRRRSGRGLGLGELTKSLGLPYNFSATAEGSDFKMACDWGLQGLPHRRKS